jgi:spermidine synthase
MAYFTRSSPIGQVFEAFSGPRAKLHVGIVGLGIGTLAAYAEPPQRWTFFEIDPALERLARDARYFTYLADARADVRVVLGDARIALRAEPAGEFGLLVLDAFSGDAVPVHLITREALHLYLQKVDEHGVLMFHVSNRYVELRPVLNALAKDANLAALTEDDSVSDEEFRHGKAASRWVVMARSAEDLGPIARDPRWRALSTSAPLSVWTDDFSNLITLFKWPAS